MPAFPTATIIAAHRSLHQGARAAAQPGKVTIADVEYDAAVAVGAVEHRQRQEDGVWVPFQSLTALVLKTALATPPKSRKALVHNGETWRIDNVGGHQATEAAWVITASRFPTAT